jgi:uncharacterized protein (PEP-CTERM system associated)
MAAGTASIRNAMRASIATALLGLAQTQPARAFPSLDPTNDTNTTTNNSDTSVPAGTALGGSALLDLQHQLQLANGLTPPAGGGWTIVPRINVEEMFNDNVLELHTPRRWDLVTVISPGISVAGDLPRAQVALDYSPTLEMYARTGPENALTQQLTGTALITLVPDLAFVDLNAFSGVASNNGLVGAGGIGGIGDANSTGVPTSTAAGLAKQERSQTSNFQVSPYLLRTFGDYGTAKLGVSAGVTTYDTTSGFAALPFPTGDNQGTRLLSTEQIAQFTSGDFLGKFSNTFVVDLTQSTSTSDALIDASTGTTTAVPSNTVTSSRQIVSDTLAYAINHWSRVFVSIGHENIRYGTFGSTRVNDLTWQVGATVDPNPDSEITVSYGHQSGFDSAQASIRYQATARTLITGSYTSTLGTELEQINQQVQSGVINPLTGQLVSGANGQPLLINVYEQGNVQTVFRYSTLSLNVQTTLNRDIITLGAIWGTQTSTGGIPTSNTYETASVQWQHELRRDLILNTSVSYSLQNFSGTQTCSLTLAALCNNGGNGTTGTLAAGATLQYTMTDTVSAHLRYLFFDRNSPLVPNRMYQDLVIVGFTKTF